MKILRLIAVLLTGIFISGSLVLSSASVVSAKTSKEAVCEGIGLAGGTNDCKPGATDPDIPGVVAKVISVLSFVIGIAAVIMIMVGGFKYVASAGDANSISGAKNTILYALVGLAVALLAQVIVRFVINRL